MNHPQYGRPPMAMLGPAEGRRRKPNVPEGSAHKIIKSVAAFAIREYNMQHDPQTARHRDPP